MSGTVWILALVSTLIVASAAGYYAFSERYNGGNPGSLFTYTLTHSTTQVVVPKGDTLIVIPLGMNNNPNETFKPLDVKVKLGVDSTIFFYNNDTYEHIIESIEWPSGSSPFDIWLLPGKSGTVQLNVTGTYEYNSELNPAALNGTITVVPG